MQIGIEPLSELLVLAGIADKARVVLTGVLSQGADIGYEGIGQACLTQERLRDVSFRPQEGICPDGRRGIMGHCFQSSCGSQINISKDCLSYIGSGEVGSAEVGSSEVGIVEVGSAEVGSAEVGFGEVGSAEVGSGEIGSAKVGYAEVGSGEVGSAEVGSAEVGKDEVGSNEVGSNEVGSNEDGFAEVGSAEDGFAEFNEYLWMLLSPCIPGLYSLPEKIMLLLIGHTVVHLLCSAFIIERHRPICKMTPFCLIFPGVCGGIHRDLFFVRLETQCLCRLTN